MKSALKQNFLTEEEYLNFEAEAEVRYEYYQGEIFAMSGGSDTHAQIGFNLAGELHAALKGKNCRGYSSDLKVRIEKADAYVYPDVMVICGNPVYHKDRKDIVKNPTLVIEVLSPSTKDFNRRGKFRRYAMLESLQEYVLVETDFPRVEVFKRQENSKWLMTPYEALENRVEFESLGLSLSMAEIYRLVDFS